MMSRAPASPAARARRLTGARGGGAHPDLRPDFDRFCHDQAHWLDDYALFRALKARYKGAYYVE